MPIGASWSPASAWSRRSAITLETFWDSLSAGRSGIGFNDAIPNYRAYPCQIGGRGRDWDPRSYMDFKEARRMSRTSQFAVAAGRMALDDSGLEVGPDNADEIGVVMGCGTTALPETDQTMRVLLEQGRLQGQPVLYSVGAAEYAGLPDRIQLGLRGYNSTIATACAASSQAIGEARRGAAARRRRGDPGGRR